jgi:hypothetical protein
VQSVDTNGFDSRTVVDQSSTNSAPSMSMLIPRSSLIARRKVCVPLVLWLVEIRLVRPQLVSRCTWSSGARDAGND